MTCKLTLHQETVKFNGSYTYGSSHILAVVGDLDELVAIICALEVTATLELRLIQHCIDRIPTTL